MSQPNRYNVMLERGLDLVTSPLLSQPGSLTGSLNYEMTALTGYRRIDGFESWDGWADGGVVNIYETTFTAENPVNQPILTIGSSIYRIVPLNGVTPSARYDFVGVVVDVDGTTARYATSTRNTAVVTGATVGIDDGVNNNTIERFDIGDVPTKLRNISSDAEEYYTTLRAYSALLRGMVTNSPRNVAGIHYGRDRLYKAVDAPNMNVFSITNGGPAAPQPGVRIRHKGIIYRLLNVALVELDPPDPKNRDRWYLMPIGTSATVNDSVVQVDRFDTVITTWADNASIPADSTLGDYAYMVYNSEPAISLIRGDRPLTPSFTFTFNTGTDASGAPPQISLPTIDNLYYATGVDGAVIQGRLTQVTREAGDWGADTAAGLAQFVVTRVESGVRDWLVNGDTIRNAWSASPTTIVMVVNSEPRLPVLAGTGLLHVHDTRYQWGTHNFYGDDALYQSYGVNGVTRAFWVDRSYYGDITTQAVTELDNPKFLAFHAGVSLALGFARGSVQLSVNGEPYNYSGFDGALEVTTGDDLTGMLESYNDSTIVFGPRSVRRITGTNDVNLDLATVSSNAGAFEYTACNAGTTAVFANQNGVYSLEHTDAYGDFAGAGLSAQISTWLVPKLAIESTSVETGGVAMAMVCRAKNQYRLWLNTGEVVSVTLTSEGAKNMISSYGADSLSGVPDSPGEDHIYSQRVPLAWTSEVADTGKEHIMVVWNAKLAEAGVDGVVGTIPDPKKVYRLDYGWGFDGVTFDHNFEVTWGFPTEGASSVSLTRVRMHGLGYGLATLDIKSSGIEDNYTQTYHDAVMDISMPMHPDKLYDSLRPVTAIVNQGNWGLGIKLKIQGTVGRGSVMIEPPYYAQVLQITAEEGSGDY